MNPPPPQNTQPQHRVTVADVARAAGVHPATVSRALNDHPRIPAATRQAIQDIARRLGYRRDPMLQALVSYRKAARPADYHSTLAWMLTDQHTDAVLYGGLKLNLAEAARVAEPFGYLIEEFRLDGMSPDKVARRLAARGISGLIFPPQRAPGTRVNLDFSGFAAVRIGLTLESPALHSVLPNQFGNTLLFCQKLRESGWSRIGFYLPKIIDARSSGAFSAAFWRWQQDIPARDRCAPGLPDGFDRAHFARWLRRSRPRIIIGLPGVVTEWMLELGEKPLPVVFPAQLSPEATDAPHIDENWPLIYYAAVRLLDGMLRHSERGVPEHPRRILIDGCWAPPGSSWQALWQAV